MAMDTTGAGSSEVPVRSLILEPVPICEERAGHPGFHNCGSSEHVCGRSCALQGALNCGLTCKKAPGHSGRHECGSGNHLCGKECALPGIDGCNICFCDAFQVR